MGKIEEVLQEGWYWEDDERQGRKRVKKWGYEMVEADAYVFRCQCEEVVGVETESGSLCDGCGARYWIEGYQRGRMMVEWRHAD